MKRDNSQPVNWTQMLVEHEATCEQATKTLERLERMSEEGHDIEPIICRIKQIIEESEHGAHQLCQILPEKPLKQMLSPNRLDLTEQEYHLLQAAGPVFPTAKGLGISPMDDYEIYRQCVYEDHEKVCFLDPNAKPDSRNDVLVGDNRRTRVRIRSVLSPEECQLAHFRLDQKEFWAKHRPDVLARCIGATSGAKRREDGA